MITNPNGKPLSEHPVSALLELAHAGLIPKAVYVGEATSGTEYHMLAEVRGWGYFVATGTMRSDAKVKAAQGLLEIVLKRICPKPRRLRYATWEAAHDDMLRQQASGKGKPLRQVYSCRCGWWHISGSHYLPGQREEKWA